MLSAERVLLAGDTHADVGFLRCVLETAATLELPVVVQLGDFGYWPDRREFLYRASLARARYGVDLWFLDGNHEHHPALAAAAAAASPLGPEPRAPRELSPGLVYLPRGARIEIAGRATLCVGGAASIDRALRRVGRDWFPDERLDDTDIASASATGPAEILLSHDAPDGWAIPGLAPDHELTPAWRAERPACEEHRGRLGEVARAVRPRVVVHGHYHHAYALEATTPWGPCRVYGLGGSDERLWGARVEGRDGELAIDPVVSPAPQRAGRLIASASFDEE